MRRFIAFALLITMLAIGPAASFAKSSTPRSAQSPVVRAVLFRADWCANCHILEPILEKAMAQAAGVPVELVVLDFTNPASWDQAIEVALDHNVVQTYNAYAGITGLVVLTAADTGERIDCINRTFSEAAIIHVMQQAVSTVRTVPQGQRDRHSAFCPAGRAPL